MENTNIQKYADMLREAEASRNAIPPLTQTDASLDIDDAYAIQLANVEHTVRAGHVVSGKKIGLTSEGIQQQLGVNEPDYGHLFAAMDCPGGIVEADKLMQPKIEGEIAFKNIKRNKKKYRITVISLFISIVMFNTFTSYLSYITASSDMVLYYDYDVSITSSGNLDLLQDDMDLILRSFQISDSLKIYNQDVIYVSNFNDQDFTLEYQNAYLNDIRNNEDVFFHLYVLDDEDYNQLTEEDALLINSKYYISYQDNNRTMYDIDVFSKKEYDIDFTFNEKSNHIHAQVIDEEIKGLKNLLYIPVPILIIPLSTYQQEFGYSQEYFSNLILFTPEYQDIMDDLSEGKLNLNLNYNAYSPAVDYANTRNLVLAVKILFYGFIALVTLIGVTSVFNTINTNINLRRKEFAMLRSVGLTPRGFNKILFFESLFFGLKSLMYGIPVSIGINVLISLSLTNVFDTSIIIPWSSILISILGVFIIVLIAMWYSARRVKKENILEALREENI